MQENGILKRECVMFVSIATVSRLELCKYEGKTHPFWQPRQFFSGSKAQLLYLMLKWT